LPICFLDRLEQRPLLALELDLALRMCRVEVVVGILGRHRRRAGAKQVVDRRHHREVAEAHEHDRRRDVEAVDRDDQQPAGQYDTDTDRKAHQPQRVVRHHHGG
jgi:hypothetical protein